MLDFVLIVDAHDIFRFAILKQIDKLNRTKSLHLCHDFETAKRLILNTEDNPVLLPNLILFDYSSYDENCMNFLNFLHQLPPNITAHLKVGLIYYDEQEPNLSEYHLISGLYKVPVLMSTINQAFDDYLKLY